MHKSGLQDKECIHLWCSLADRSPLDKVLLLESQLGRSYQVGKESLLE